MLDEQFFREEVRDDFLVDSNRKQLWGKLLGILESFISICERHNLRYFAHGGTLLGAVRHKGFIPWDDDLDILMPRMDYERFLKIASTELPTHLSLVNSQNIVDYPYLLFSKINDDSTTFITAHSNAFHMPHGISIDIFPMDGLPKAAAMRYRFVRAVTRCREFVDRLHYHYRWRSNWGQVRTVKAAVLFPVFWLARRIFSLQRCSRWLNGVLQWYDYDQSDAWRRWWRGIHDPTFDKHDFDQAVWLPFEHLRVRSPAGYDKYLRDLFGDYMALPPKEKRGMWHDVLIIDCEKPDSYYTPLSLPHGAEHVE